MRNARKLTPILLAFALIALGLQSVPAGAATPTFFGAKLTSQSQPSNAEFPPGVTCDESGGIPHGATCTWVSVQAFENGGHEQAPVTGTIKHVKLVSCVPGSFTLQLAQANPMIHNAFRVVSNGPVIKYVGQSGANNCNNGKYIVQSYPVKVHVVKGNFIAIKTKATGAISCSGGEGVLLYAPPLAPGGAFVTTSSGASCNLLVQLSYV
jgi:hypothetical protein